MMKGLPKAKLFWVRYRRFWFRSRLRRSFFIKVRNANAAFVWIGPLEIGWRMPWLKQSARSLYPHLFKDEIR